MSATTRNGGDPGSMLRAGARYVVRHQLEPDATHRFTDSVGELLHADDQLVVVRTRRHGNVEIERRLVTAIKEIPPTPGRRGRPHQAVGIEDLERLSTDAWAPHERDQLGEWVLRAAGGYTGRANSALVVGQPDRPFLDALGAVATWYEERGLPPLLHLPLPPGTSPEQDPFVVEATTHGWHWFQLTDVMTAAVRAVAEATPGTGPPLRAGAPEDCALGVGESPDPTVIASSDLTDTWWSLADDRMLAAPDAARAVLTGSPEQWFLTAHLDGQPRARARLALAHGWGGLYAVETHPDTRRRGLASALIGCAARMALDHGTLSLHLQVSADNSAAIRLYERLGFTRHHQYVYLRRAS